MVANRKVRGGLTERLSEVLSTYVTTNTTERVAPDKNISLVFSNIDVSFKELFCQPSCAIKNQLKAPKAPYSAVWNEIHLSLCFMA